MNHARAEWIGIDQKIALLRDPGSYTEQTSDVSVIETHKSWVFLTDSHAYKLKKPIRYDSIDFQSLSTRCANCESEVVLNRRLAGDVYIGVERVTAGEQGELELGGDGPLVDCLVKMKRLPSDRMLSFLLDTKQVEQDEIRRLGLKLAEFYRDSPVALHGPDLYRQHLLDEMNTNLAGLSEPGRGIDYARVERLHKRQITFMHDQATLLKGRVVAGRIVDGHGDLRAEHVCLLPDPVIFDCLEFNDRLRRVDPVDELSFLALECERLGDSSIGGIVFDVYSAFTSDDPPEYLIAFYKVYRACMWARLAIWRTRELEPEKWGKWTDRAETYLRIAERHAAEMKTG